jgi:hypothetical protein
MPIGAGGCPRKKGANSGDWAFPSISVVASRIMGEGKNENFPKIG